ncbi:MAG: acetyltransferase [Limisphaerales bacterium]
MSTDCTAKFNEWALVELFGHNRIVGLVSEASLAGRAFLRVDVPPAEGAAGFTRYFSPGAIYAINPVTEDVARAMLVQYRPEPVARYQLPQIAVKVGGEDGESDEF